MSIHPESELLSSYADGELAAPEVATLESHLATCRECSSILKALQATIVEVRALPAVEMPQQAGWATRGAISRARSRGGRFGKIVVAATSAAALIAGIGFVATNNNSRDASGGVTNGVAAERAPQLGASVIVLALDYNAENVRSVFDFAGKGYNARSSAKTADSAELTSGQSAPGAVAPPASPAPSYDFGPCERKILSSSSRTARAVLYVVAHYEGKQAYFMIYDVPAEDSTTRELWVVRPGDCEVLHFDQKRLA